MSYNCDDVQLLWIANIAQPLSIPQITEPCDYGETWLLQLTDEDGWCLLDRFTPTGGIPDTPHQNILERVTIGYLGAPEKAIEARVRIDEFLCEINRWQTQQYTNNSIWLLHQISGEGGWRRSLLYGATPVDNLRKLGDVNSDTVFQTQLALERHWCWEDVASEEYAFGTRPVWGDIIDTTFEGGTADGRICRFQIQDRATAVTPDSDIISKIWVGIKEDAGCGLDEWQPDMDLNQGFTGFTDSDTAVNTLSLGELAAVCTFATDPSRIKRIGIELFQAFPGANYDQWRGSYIVLMRCRVDDASTSVTIQADSGWRTTRLKALIGQPVVVDGADGTDYRMIQLGVANIPEDMHRLCANRPGFDELDNYSIGIEASREAGAGSLAMTDLYLIPYEHSAVITNLNPTTEYVNFENMWFTVINNEDDTSMLRTYTQRIAPTFISPDSDFSIDNNDFSMPKKGSRIVAAMNVYDQDLDVVIHTKSFLWSLEISVFKRWLSYRV